MKRKRGRPPGENSVFPSGTRVTAFRMPAEFRSELDKRSSRRGITLQAYIRDALYYYMREEDAFEEWQKARREKAEAPAK